MRHTITALIISGLLALGAASVHAVPVTVDGTDYNITTVQGPAGDYLDLLQGQIWYGDESLAADFAVAVGGSLGYPNEASPFFVTQVDPGMVALFTSTLGGLNDFRRDDIPDIDLTYAVQTPVASVPEPGAFALFGLGLVGLIVARRQRR